MFFLRCERLLGVGVMVIEAADEIERTIVL